MSCLKRTVSHHLMTGIALITWHVAPDLSINAMSNGGNVKCQQGHKDRSLSGDIWGRCLIETGDSTQGSVYVRIGLLPAPLLRVSVGRLEALGLTHITYLITYSVEQIPWEANWFSSSPEIPGILWNPKVHYCSRKCPPPVPFMSQLDPVHIPLHGGSISPKLMSFFRCLGRNKVSAQIRGLLFDCFATYVFTVKSC